MGTKDVDKALAKKDSGLAIAELRTDMMNSSSYNKYSHDEIRQLATQEIDRRLSSKKEG